MYYPIGWHRVLKLDLDSSDHDHADILSVQANQERELIFILTTKTIHIWFSRPAIEIVCHRRSQESVAKIGLNKTAVWKTDSSVIVVATEKDQLLFYQLRRRASQSGSSRFLLANNEDDDGIYRVRYDTKNFKRSISRELPPSATDSVEHVPALTIFSFGKLDLSSIGVACLVSAEEELIVGAKNGDIYGVHWDGNVDERFPWTLIEQSIPTCDYVVDVKISSVLGGFTLVFSSGRIAFMPLKPSHKTTPRLENGRNLPETKQNRSVVNYLEAVDNATCVEINHKYRLAAFGLKSSEVLVCNIEDSSGSLVANHRLNLKNCKFPVQLTKLGAVKCMRYSPDGFALVVSWEDENFAIWSVFGSLLFCSNQWTLDSESIATSRPLKLTSFAWSREGYELWMSVILDDKQDRKISDSPIETEDSATDKTSCYSSCNGRISAPKQEVVILPLAHCNLTSSPHSSCSTDAIILMAEDRIFIGPSIPQGDKFDHWIVVDIPYSYLRTNYPIRYATVDRLCKNLAVAGHKGLALYSIELRRWNFLKKSQENSFSVCGDIIWWRNYLLASCFNLENESFELRAYSTDEDLENSHLVYQWIPMEIIRMSIFENRLLVLYSDGTLGMLMLNMRRRPTTNARYKSSLSRSNSVIGNTNGSNGVNKEVTSRIGRSDSVTSWSGPTKSYSLFQESVLQICPIENLVISNLQANAFCISSIALTRLHFKNNRTDDSILVNACGKLFLLEREEPPNLSNPSPPNDDTSSLDQLGDLSISSHRSNELGTKINYAKKLSDTIHLTSASLKHKEVSDGMTDVTFKAISVIATNVEQFWISPETSSAPEMSYFKQSLWLFCGGSDNYLQIWLPLLNDKNDPPVDLYVPDRIMLPIRCDIYPLAVRSSSSVMAGVFDPDDAIVLGAESDTLYRDCILFNHFPYSTVKRQCRVYLHRILRELLLNQHLGYYARKIAEKSKPLPYFAHCFELLLYEVLEDEATSPVPLPDPMLPQIVRFIKEFPVYLETVVHCARKSELSMWSYLFDERAVGSPRRLFQECLDKKKLDTAASCLIILQSLDRHVITHKMVEELLKASKGDPKFNYLVDDLERFLSRAEFDSACSSGTGSPSS